MNGTAWVRAARTDTPRNIVPRMVLMSTSVVRAFWAWGSRKMLTPLEMASVPVMAELPLAKARSRRKAETPRTRPPLAWPTRHRSVDPGGVAETAQGGQDEAGDDQDGHVGDEEVGGMAKSRPASLMPRRLPKAMRRRSPPTGARRSATAAVWPRRWRRPRRPPRRPP